MRPIDDLPVQLSEIRWLAGERSKSANSPAQRQPQRPANLTRSAMVAATVAAVASSAVFVPGMAGASAAKSTTQRFQTVSAPTARGRATASAHVPPAASSQTFNGMGGSPGITYTVKPGDTVHDIAARYGVSTMAVIQANNLGNPDLIFPGDQIDVPAAGGSESITIEVKAGDTINKLADRYGVNPSVIVGLPANKISNPNLIVVGQTLTIPGASAASSSAEAQSTATAEAPAASTDTATTQSSSDSSQSQDQASTPAPAPAQQSTPAATPSPTPEPTQAPAPAAAQGFVWPVQGTITQKFGPTSLGLEPAYLGYAHFHQGLDIANAMYTPIHAAGAGTVIFAGWSNYGYGFCVQIDHGNGLVTLYGHMAQQPSVTVGEHVAAGQLIGKMGSTGASTGSHTHFAVQKNGVWVDPLNYLP